MCVGDWDMNGRGEKASKAVKGKNPSRLTVCAIFYPKFAENTRRFEKSENLTKYYGNQYVVV